MRLDEAIVLFEAGHYGGAYYLAGYSVELALKACLARQVQEHDFPDKNAVIKAWTHNLNDLLDQSGLRREMNEKRLKSFWGVVKDWTEQKRYDPNPTKREAEELLAAIRDPNHGVMQWLETRW
ncbi:HEPN domain-containing protein [Gemmatimonadota bacterium]